MTLDEAIEYYINVATRRAVADEGMSVNDKWNETKFMTKKESEQIIADNQQLAAWLRELKDLREQNVELKNILNAALKDIHGKNIYEVMNACKLCAIKFQQLCDIFPWQYANEALKLIGSSENGT